MNDTPVSPMDRAMEKVRDGRWKPNPATGEVIGCYGKPIGTVHRSGYVYLILGTGDRHRTAHVKAHRLIWTAVNGPIPEGLHINHINGVKTDNRLVNLELATPAENVQHAFRTGLRKPVTGVKHHMSRLDPAKVRWIREQRAAGMLIREIAHHVGVGASTVDAVLAGRTWKHVA